MRIVIDLQACQSSGSRTRGIGRYSLALAQAMARNAGEHEIFLLLSGLFPETIEPLREAFEGLVPAERIRIWQAPTPVAEIDPQNAWRRGAAERVREQALAELRPDIVHVTSLFEGHIDDAVSSVGACPDALPTAVTLYDLIPLVYASHYLADASARAWYHRKLAALKNADLLLAISGATREEGLDWLRMAPERIVNISSAVDERFYVRDYPTHELAAMRAQYGLTRRFVMYTGGIDHRKNIEGLVRAFAALPPALRRQYQLAVVCSIRPNDSKRLQELAQAHGLGRDELVLTGFVPDEVLPMLYNDCALFVFPSWHEGFGLPALEAMACGAPVIAANNSSLPEVIGREDALFDSRDDAAITAKMALALGDAGFSASLRAHALEQAKKFSWDASAVCALRAFEEFHAKRQAAAAAVVAAPLRKPRLAYVSPLPPLRSGIADYSAALAAELARFYDVELVVAQDNVEGDALTANFPLRDWRWFSAHAHHYDRVLYHFGNSEFHTHMFALLEQHPGVIVLHDFYMSGILAYSELRDLPGRWSAALYDSHGYHALQSRQAAQTEAEVVMQFPCSRALLGDADGVIVHSEYARTLAAQWYGDEAAGAMVRAPLMRALPHPYDRNAVRTRLGFGADDFVVCSFGMVAATKKNKELLEAWSASPLAQDPRARLVFVGQTDGGPYGSEFERMVQQAGANVRLTGFAEPQAFQDYLAAADVSVQLRTLSRGETSAAVLDCMAHGCATIINAHAAMAELPDDALLMLPDDFSVAQLGEALVRLRTDAVLRQALGDRARAWVATRHSPEVVAARYRDAIEDFAAHGMPARRRRALGAIAALPTQVEPSMAEMAGVAAALSASAPRIGLPQLFVDVTDQRLGDAASARLAALLADPPAGLRIEPVRQDGNGFRYARAFAADLLQLDAMADEVVDARHGDRFAGVRLTDFWRRHGVAVFGSLDEALGMAPAAERLRA